jgi:hypothetical protein
MRLLIPSRFADALDHGAAVIVRSRLIRHDCKVTGVNAGNLACDSVLARRSKASRIMRGASDRADGSNGSLREVWRHRPTGHYWVVMTDTMDAPASAAGPFSADEWDPVLREYVILDRNHSLTWLREHFHEFVRENDGQL